VIEKIENALRFQLSNRTNSPPALRFAPIFHPKNINLTTYIQSGGLDNGSFWADFPAVKKIKKNLPRSIGMATFVSVSPCCP
jgi:hypothetical protein